VKVSLDYAPLHGAACGTLAVAASAFHWSAGLAIFTAGAADMVRRTVRQRARERSDRERQRPRR
jgi:hypothetical protein